MQVDFTAERDAVAFFRYLCLCARVDGLPEFEASRSSAWGRTPTWTVEASSPEMTANWSDAVTADFESLKLRHSGPRTGECDRSARYRYQARKILESNAIYAASYCYAAGYPD